MKIQDQVIALKQARKLKELGVVQKGYFQWQETTNTDPYINHTVFGESTNENEYAAFTVAELGVMLPPKYYSIIPLFDRQRTSAPPQRVRAYFGYVARRTK